MRQNEYDTVTHKNLVTVAGEAAGKISGVNHVQLVVSDMNRSVWFYRDVLGLKLVRTMGLDENHGYAVALGMNDFAAIRNYFFDMGKGNYLTLVEVKTPVSPQTSIYAEGLWPGAIASPDFPSKMDHLAFNVENRAELVWFRDRLIAHGTPCSPIMEHEEVDGSSPSQFCRSVYFYDPDGTALEVATFDWDHPKWTNFKPEDWLNDPEPVPSTLPQS